ncbi:hypothetical protein NMY22_g14596 [Coprinellus aureogranulatus]|nr:hypothetical protein NMY22_g14596 [Coprinellus aureogranulatus]
MEYNLPPLAKLPDGQICPSDLTCAGGLHFVVSERSLANPDLQVVQPPVVSAHWVHPTPHALQSPVDVRKKPEAHFPQATPSAVDSKPVVHSHWPLLPHTPFAQLQSEGLLAIVGFRQRPEPETPSSHESQFEGQANPAAHRQVPFAKHTPPLLHVGEQEVDSRPVRIREPAAFEGRWLTSGMGSHIVNCVLALAPVTIDATALSAIAIDWVPLSGTEVLALGTSGSGLNVAWPEYREPA